jgi:hypothetical protein
VGPNQQLRNGCAKGMSLRVAWGSAVQQGRGGSQRSRERQIWGWSERIGLELMWEQEWAAELEAGAEFGLAAAQIGRKRGSGICNWR